MKKGMERVLRQNGVGPSFLGSLGKAKDCI